MSPYCAILSARFRMLLQYRAAAVAGFSTQLFWGLIRVMIMDAFYRASVGTPPMRIEEVITYIWLGQALLGLIPWNVDREIQAMIREGSVAYELTRPLDLYTLWFMRAVAWRAAATLLRAVPLLVVALLFLGMRLPVSPAAALGFALTVLGALMMSAALTNLLNISLLWTLSGEGAMRLVPALVVLFSGNIVPLPLFPDWMHPLLSFLPFRGLVDAPFRLYLGHIPAVYTGAALAHQIAWTTAFVLMGRWMLARGTRRLVVQGG